MARSKRSTSRISFDNFIKIVGLLLALGAPIVSLISMMSSYREKQQELERRVAVLTDKMDKLSDTSEDHNDSLQGFKQTVLDNHAAIQRLETSFDAQNEKILELWKQTSNNNARIDAQQTEIILLRNSQAQGKK